MREDAGKHDHRHRDHDRKVGHEPDRLALSPDGSVPPSRRCVLSGYIQSPTLPTSPFTPSITRYSNPYAAGPGAQHPTDEKQVRSRYASDVTSIPASSPA